MEWLLNNLEWIVGSVITILGLIFGVSFVKGTFWAGATSLSLELIQLAFAIGGADITDLITNTLGAAAGIFIYLLSTKIFKNEKKLKNTVNITAFILFSIFIALMILLIVANN